MHISIINSEPLPVAFPMNRFAALLFLLFMSSCATILSGSRQSIVFISNPEGANIRVNGREVGVTPCVIKIKKMLTEPKVEFDKEGYVKNEFLMENRFQFLTCINLLNIFGWMVDYGTGAVKYYTQNEYAINLQPKEGTPMHERLSVLTRVRSIDNIPVDDDLIFWNHDRKLVFNDFKAAAPTFAREVATTSANFSCYYSPGDSMVDFYITSVFYKDLSWFKSPDIEENRMLYDAYFFKDREDIVQYILNHEQRHFDIAELYSRIFKERVINYSFKSQTLQQDLSNLYMKTNTEYEKTQRDYDKKCGHGLFRSNQEKWNKLIDDRLSEYEKYKDARLHVRLY